MRIWFDCCMRWMLVVVAVLAMALSACGSSRRTVPNIQASGGDYEVAYAMLHEAGFRVSTDMSLLHGKYSGIPFGPRPVAGTELRAGSTVSLVEYRYGEPGSSAVAFPSRAYRVPEPACTRRPALVPNLRGETLSPAVRENGCFSITAKLPRLHSANAPSFLDNYVIEHQLPKAGTENPVVSASSPSDYRPEIKLVVSVRE